MMMMMMMMTLMKTKRRMAKTMTIASRAVSLSLQPVYNRTWYALDVGIHSVYLIYVICVVKDFN